MKYLVSLLTMLLFSATFAWGAGTAMAVDQGGAHDPLVRARAFVKDGKREQAAELYKQALALSPSNALAHNELGVLLVGLGESEAAKRSLWTAVYHDPNFVAAWANLAETLRRSKSYTQAYSAYGKAIELASDRSTFWYGLAMALKDGGKKAQAMSAFTTFLEREDAGTKRHTKASNLVKTWQQAGVKPISPKWLPARVPEAIERRVQLAARMSKRVGPEENMKPSITPDKTPQRAPSQQKVDTQTPASELKIPEPPPKESLLTLAKHNGDGAFANKRFVEALQSYQGQLDDAPTDVILLYKAGATMAILGDFVGSNRMWRRALALAPERGYILRQSKHAASRLAERIPLPAAPEKGDVLISVRQHLLAGHPARVIALTEGVQSEEVLYIRGEAALRMGLLEHAFSAFSNLLKLTPDDRQAQGGLLASRLLRGADEALQADIDTWMEEQGTGAERFMLIRQLQAERRIRFGKTTLAEDEDEE